MILHHGDCLEVLKTLSDNSIDTCITSPPYFGLRSYGGVSKLGEEDTPEEYVKNIVNIFQQVSRVLKDTGTVWLNVGDSYVGADSRGNSLYAGKQATNNGSHCLKGRIARTYKNLSNKNLLGIPWRVAFALQSDGWILRQDIIWHKPNPMPESVKDRCTKSHEYIFLLSKNKKYYFDSDAIRTPFNEKYREGKTKERATTPLTKIRNDRATSGGFSRTKTGANKRSVWTVTTKPFRGAHFATYPEDLILPCVLAGAPVNGVVLDPFMGSGTTGVVALKNNRQFIGIEQNLEYLKIAECRLKII
jgi:DNA modification methylase